MEQEQLSIKTAMQISRIVISRWFTIGAFCYLWFNTFMNPLVLSSRKRLGMTLTRERIISRHRVLKSPWTFGKTKRIWFINLRKQDTDGMMWARFFHTREKLTKLGISSYAYYYLSTIGGKCTCNWWTQVINLSSSFVIEESLLVSNSLSASHDSFTKEGWNLATSVKPLKCVFGCQS